MQVITFIQVTKSYIQERKVLQDITFSAKEGEIIGLIGPNGAGKTTLLRLAAELFEPSSGKIEIGVKKNSMAYMPANGGLVSSITVKDNIQIWAAAYCAGEEDVKYLIKKLSLEKILEKKVKTLSSGMKTMVSFMCTILGKPKLILLDEPFVHLDVEGCLKVIDILNTFLQKSTIIISSHDLEYVDEISDTLLILNKGRQIFFNTADCLKKVYGSRWFKISFHGLIENGRRKQIEQQFCANFIESSQVYFPYKYINLEEAERLLIREQCRINQVVENCSELKDIYLNLEKEALVK